MNFELSSMNNLALSLLFFCFDSKGFIPIYSSTSSASETVSKTCSQESSESTRSDSSDSDPSGSLSSCYLCVTIYWSICWQALVLFSASCGLIGLLRMPSSIPPLSTAARLFNGRILISSEPSESSSTTSSQFKFPLLFSNNILDSIKTCDVEFAPELSQAYFLCSLRSTKYPKSYLRISREKSFFNSLGGMSL